ncbi:MAG: 23S rRNA (uracil(1939)-C(5))-methyltransferase RlmD [Clostridiales bacterium]|nr:23S rRNA (uracil(1939)-C(5))-methyltransferase RlmD [Clostridiales bacterium]
MAEPFESMITGLDEAGRGIGKEPSGKTFFCEGVFPGERCLVQEISSSARFSVCEALSVLEASSSRTAPFEPDKLLCGGLPLAALSYPAQLEFKASRVRECLERIGRFDGSFLDSVMEPVVPCDPPLRYRNHMQYAISGGRVGLLASGSHELADYDGELIEYGIFTFLREALEKSFERAPTNLFEGLVLRASKRTNEVLAEFVSGSTAPHEIVIRDCSSYIDATGIGKKFEEICTDNGFKLNGLLLRISPDKASRRTRGGTRVVLSGVDYYDEIFYGRRMRVKAGSFFQVNTRQAEELAKLASEGCAEATVIYDLYCGCGTLGIGIKKPGQKIFGIETVPEAIESAKINRSLAFPDGGAEECSYICKDVLKADMASLIRSGKLAHPDTIIVDPPRKGMDPGVINRIIEIAPKSVVYVSCDPATLSRDLKMFVRNYEILKVTPVDLFPHAAHVETVVLLSKLSSAPKLEVKINMSELDLTEAEAKATYDEIQEYVKQQTGLHVTHLNIAQIKRKYGIIERVNYNLPKCENPKRPNCPPEKEKAIVAALKHFKMI